MKTLALAVSILCSAGLAAPAAAAAPHRDAGRPDVALPDIRPPLRPLPVKAPDPDRLERPLQQRPADENVYAAREAATPEELNAFRGGGASIYIGGGAVSVVLLIVLLVILL